MLNTLKKNSKYLIIFKETLYFVPSDRGSILYYDISDPHR